MRWMDGWMGPLALLCEYERAAFAGCLCCCPGSIFAERTLSKNGNIHAAAIFFCQRKGSTHVRRETAAERVSASKKQTNVVGEQPDTHALNPGEYANWEARDALN